MSKLSVSQESGNLVVNLPHEIDVDLANDLITASKGWMGLPAQLIIFNFKDVMVMKPASYRAFVVIARSARQMDKRVVSIHMNENLSKRVRAEGVTSSFNPVANLNFETSPPPKSASADVTLINPFVEAIVNTLEVQAQTQCKAGKPFLLKVEDKEYRPAVGIVGLLNLNSPKFTGSIALVFAEKVFLQVYENMFGEKHEKITPEIQDAAAEILNIIYGTAKTKLNQIPGVDLQSVVPTVVSGEKINLHQNTREKIIILPFESTAGNFQVEIAIENK